MVEPSEAELENLKNWNKRLYNQKGAFFVFGNKPEVPYHVASTIEAENTVILPEIVDTTRVFDPRFLIRIPICSEMKESILQELADKGIDGSFVYPDTT